MATRSKEIEYLAKVNQMISEIKKHEVKEVIYLDSGSKITNFERFISVHEAYLNNSKPLTNIWNIYARRIHKVYTILKNK